MTPLLDDSVRARAMVVADGIGSRLVEDAIWYDGRCNWVGGDPVEAGSRGMDVTHSALGHWLYSGTCGVALFLAELYHRTGECQARRTAMGAARRALPREAETPYPRRLGLFAGWSGVAVAVARAGVVMDVPELTERADALARATLLAHSGEGEDFDVVSGHAGDLLAVLELFDDLADPDYLAAAVALGDRLLSSAEHDEAGASWSAPDNPRQQNLTGLSHGASGAAWALLELWRASGEARFRVGAEAAFAYERYWFDATAGNWPDFRGETPGRRPGGYRRFRVFWCHGAPGIALTRLRAHALTGDQVFADEADVALATTRAEALDYLDAGIGNFSLCHGLAGLADVLLCASAVRGARTVDDELVGRVVSAGDEKYAAPEIPWPCGTHGGESPGALLGLAGIGSLYLRVCYPVSRSFLTLIF